MNDDFAKRELSTEDLEAISAGVFTLPKNPIPGWVFGGPQGGIRLPPPRLLPPPGLPRGLHISL